MQFSHCIISVVLKGCLKEEHENWHERWRAERKVAAVYQRDHRWSILRHSMGGALPLYCLTVDMMLIGFHLSKDSVPSERHVSQSFMKVLIWGNINLKCYKFLSIKTLHVTVNVVAACLIWLVCLINMDVDEISADRILWVSDEYQILNVFMLFCTHLLQGLIFHSYQSQCVNPSWSDVFLREKL